MNRRLLVSLAILACSCKPKINVEQDAAPTASVAASVTASAAPSPTPTPSASASAKTTKKSAPDAGDCIDIEGDDSPVDLVGKVYTGQHSHPNGSMFTFYGLKLAKAKCLVGSEDAKTIDDVQLFSMDEEKTLKSFVNKKAHVIGKASAPMTAWHVRLALVQVDSIAAP